MFNYNQNLMTTTPKILKRIAISFLFILAFTTLQFCKSSQKATSKKNVISYTQNIAPIIENSCTPCHFPEQGKKKMLNTYDAVKENIEDILRRVQLADTDKEFMPFKSKKPALSNEQIELLKGWVKQKMPN